MKIKQTILQTKNLSKSYRVGQVTVNALSNINLTVARGEFVAIMGSSGSGKSTLLQLLGAIDKPTSGQIIISDNISLTDLPDKKATLLRRKKIGFVFQFFNLIPTLSAEENIALPFIISGQRQASYKKKVEKVLKIVGLTNRRFHKPLELSGGEQQRIAIARALIIEPEIILADELTGSLDSKTGHEIMQLLRKSCDQLGQTIVIVTHDPEVAKYSDRVIVLRDGKIADIFNNNNEDSISIEKDLNVFQ